MLHVVLSELDGHFIVVDAEYTLSGCSL